MEQKIIKQCENICSNYSRAENRNNSFMFLAEDPTEVGDTQKGP